MCFLFLAVMDISDLIKGKIECDEEKQFFIPFFPYVLFFFSKYTSALLPLSLFKALKSMFTDTACNQNSKIAICVCKGFSICMILRWNSFCVFLIPLCVFVWLQGGCWEWLPPHLAEQSDSLTRRQWWPRYCFDIQVSYRVFPCDYSAVSDTVCTEGSQWTVNAVICGQPKWPFLIASCLFSLLCGWEWRSLSWWIACTLEPMFSYYLPFISPSPASSLTAYYLMFMADFDSSYVWHCHVPHRVTLHVRLHCYIAQLLSFLLLLKALGIT